MLPYPMEKDSGIEKHSLHEYFGIDMDIVWDIIENYLPNLEVEARRILEDEKSG